MSLALFYLLVPALLVILCQRISVLEKVGVVVLAFGGGILLAMTVDISQFFSDEVRIPIQKNISEISISSNQVRN